MLRCSLRSLALANAISPVSEKSVQKSTSRIKVEIAEEVVKNFTPSGSTAPELLSLYVEPKPFFSRKKLQLFAASALVGAVTVSVLYFLVSKSIADDLDREYTYAEVIRDSNERHSVLQKEFVAPSSYLYLKDKMERHRKESLDRQKETVSILHSEIIYRAKMWWNRQLVYIDSAVSQMYEMRKSKGELELIRAAVGLRGFDLVRVVDPNASAHDEV